MAHVQEQVAVGRHDELVAAQTLDGYVFDGSVEASMGIGVESYGAVMIEEPARRGRRLTPPARRAVFLLGTSLFVESMS